MKRKADTRAPVHALVAGWLLASGCAADNDARIDAAGEAGEDTAMADDAVPPDDVWSSAAEVGGGAVQEFGAAALGGELYVVGGMLETAAVLASVWVYDPNGDAWSEAAELPEARHHPNVAAYDGAVYVLGSLEGTGFAARGDMWRYDPSDDAWEELGQMPSPRGASAVAVTGDWIYVAGGYDGSRAVTTFSAYNPAEDVWDTDLPELPEPRDHLVGAEVDGIVYAVGGRDTSIANLNGRVDAFDPEGDEWQSRAEMITPRAGGAGGVVDGEILVVGGEGNPEPGTGGVFAEAEAYDPASDTWRSLPDMPTPRHGMLGAGIGDALYVPGGAKAQGLNETTAVHEVLTP